MVKRAPGNVRYLGYFGGHILTPSFTARDPNRLPTHLDARGTRRTALFLSTRVVDFDMVTDKQGSRLQPSRNPQIAMLGRARRR